MKATIKILGREYKSSGKTIEECLDSLRPGFCKASSVLTIEKGDKKVDRILGIMATSRLFSPSLAIRKVQTKQIVSLLNI